MTWMNWRCMYYPHDLGNLHMIHNDNSSSQPQQWKRSIFYIGRWQHILNVFIYPYGSKYLLRKWDWGMIWGVSRTFLDSVWIHRVYIYIMCIYIYTLLWYFLIFIYHSGNQTRQWNIHNLVPCFFQSKPPWIFRPWPGRPCANPAFGMKSRKLYSTSFGERNSGHGK